MPKYSKLFIRRLIASAAFPIGKRDLTTQKILDALRYFRATEKTYPYFYCPHTGTRIGIRPPQKGAGRPNQVNQRQYLISVLFSVWLQSFGKRPRINRRGSKDTAFVMFAAEIMLRAGFANHLDNINAYRTHYNQLAKSIDAHGAVFTAMRV